MTPQTMHTADQLKRLGQAARAYNLCVRSKDGRLRSLARNVFCRVLDDVHKEQARAAVVQTEGK